MIKNVSYETTFPIFVVAKIMRVMKRNLLVYICLILLICSCNTKSINQRWQEYVKYEKTFIEGLDNYEDYDIRKKSSDACDNLVFLLIFAFLSDRIGR